MDQVLKSHKLPKLTQQEIYNLYNPITAIQELEFELKPPKKKISEPTGF